MMVPAGPTRTTRPRIDSLTSRQMQIVRMLVAGHTAHEIAKELDITEPTVYEHPHNARKRWGARTLAQLAAFAVKYRYAE